MGPQTLPPSIEPAEITWHDGLPESAKFGDVYFSRENGLEETRYVFLKHNGLPDRFHKVPEGGSFVIAESGFGTGLNFLAAWQAWRATAPEHSSTFHFVSVERFPLTKPDLKKALALWPELSELAGELLNAYPPLVRGTHRLLFDGGRVRLTLHFGDILEAWNSLTFKADAWFLDGFAPSANPEMWLDEAIQLIREHSQPGTTLATFTAVGRIRRALAEAGFNMSKQPGFGRKREMLTGEMPVTTSISSAKPKGPTAIIGAGIAGCLLARNLAERGKEVILIDAAEKPGAGASGNLQGATYVKLGVDFNDQTELALSSLLFAQRFYEPYRDNLWHPTGLLQLASSAEEQSRQARFVNRNHYPTEILRPVGQEEARQLTGIRIKSGGLWFPGSGWLQPAAMCRTLADHPRIQTEYSFPVEELQAEHEQWLVKAKDGRTVRAEAVALCAGHKTPELLPSGKSYRFKSIRGQVSYLNSDTHTLPSAVICGEKYLNPEFDGIAVTGATFDLRDNTPTPTPSSHEENLRKLQDMTPDLFPPDEDIRTLANQSQGRVAFRCTTHDYQPVADFIATEDKNDLPPMMVMTGLGSKGLAYTPLLAEYMADRILGQPESLTKKLARRVASKRMEARDRTN